MSRRCSLLLLLRWPSPPAAAPARAADGPAIVATTTQLGDMARNIAPGAKVTTLLAPNTDPHEYEVRPDDVKALASADIVLRSGGEVDEWLDGALESAGVDEQDVVDAGAAAGLEGDDPHWWQDPRRAEKAAVAIGAALRRAGVPEDAAAYVKRLQALDAGIRACMDRVPAAAAAARHQPRRARLLRAPLRPAGRRHGDPGADHRRPAVRGRGLGARGRRSSARA